MEGERRIFLEPYADESRLGSMITVNQAAESEVFNATGLKRNVVVYAERPERRVVSSPESNVIRLFTGVPTHPEEQMEEGSALTLSPDRGAWQISILSEVAERNVESWMSKNYKSNQGRRAEALNRRYITEISRQVTEGISSADREEKKARLVKTLTKSLPNDAILAVSAAGILFGVDFIWNGFNGVFNESDPQVQDPYILEAGIGALILLAGQKGAMEFVRVDDGELSWWEHFVPNLQARSRIRGAVALHRNKEHLIEERS